MCTLINIRCTLHWNRQGKKQLQDQRHPCTNTSGPLHFLRHWPFSTGHLSGQAFCRIPESLVMTISLSLHAWHLLWGWAIQNWFKDLKQQKVRHINSLVCTHVRWGNTICAFVLSYNSLTSKCRAPLPQLVLASVNSLCIRVYAQCFTHTGKNLRILLIFSLKSSSHAN